MRIKKIKWPHFAERDPKCPICYLVVHCFALSETKRLEVWNQLDNGVGPHYVIDNKGNITQFVEEDKVAWHAGQSYWHGQTGLNATSIGIELYSPSYGQKKFPKIQLDAFVKLATQIIKKYHIRAENIVGHSDIAPTRKVDPGKNFPWEELSKKGIGLWPKQDGPSLPQCKYTTLLSEIGYDIQNPKAALLAFMRHFMPDRIQTTSGASQTDQNLASAINILPDPDDDVLKWLSK